MSFNKLFNLTNLTLVTALSLSTVAAYYSIIGLTAIFAGAVIPIIIMGSILEIGKIVTTVWLRKYWHMASWLLKLYLVPAVVVLALLTSMGIFGFLSKAHSDTGLVSGDVQAKLSLYDEKIKTQRDNIELARKALQQMDAQVDARLTRGDSESSAERAIQIRRQQASERAKLQKDILDAQAVITKLNEERAPIAAENRKVEAEVGPIKYIAALIYGDNPDNNLLEKSVRWVIIILVLVFDPLAIALVLAANSSKEYDKQVLEAQPKIEDPVVEPTIEHTTDKIEPTSVIDKLDLSKLTYLWNPGKGFGNLKPMVYKPEPTTEPTITPEPEPEPIAEIETENVTIEKPYVINDNGYAIVNGKQISTSALRESNPELFLGVDTQNLRSFGTEFPKQANKNDTFVRIDTSPNRAFKFDGKRWVEISRDLIDDNSYIQFLISKIDNGEHDIELLSEKEQEKIRNYLNTQQT